MKSLQLILFGVTAILLFGCLSKNNKVEDDEIIGEWICDLDDNGYSGEETVVFRDGQIFYISDSVCFSGMDSGFSYAVNISMSIEGKWRLSNDSIYLLYNTKTLNVQNDEYSVKLVAEGADRGVVLTDDVKEMMVRDLVDNIAELYESQYNSIADREVVLGNVIELSDSALLLENGGAYLRFKKLN